MQDRPAQLPKEEEGQYASDDEEGRVILATAPREGRLEGLECHCQNPLNQEQVVLAPY